MEDRLKTYYSLVDGYSLNKPENFDYIDESEPEEINLFKHFCPIKISVLMRDIEFVIEEMCKKLKIKEKVLEEIKNLKNDVDNNLSTYKWRDIDIKDLLKGDYKYLVDKVILKYDLVPNVNCYINKYDNLIKGYTYPFSLKELYFLLLERGINIMVNNYFEDPKSY